MPLPLGEEIAVPAAADLRLRSRERYRRALATTTSNLGARGIAIVTAIAIVPLTLGYLGPERYGLWTTVTSLAAFLVFADLGVGNGLKTMVAAAAGSEDDRAVARIAASGVWILTAIGVGIAALTVAASTVVDWAALFNIQDPVAQAEVAPAVLVVGLCLAASLPISVASHIRDGFQEGYVNAAFLAVGNLLGLLLVLAAIDFRLGLPLVVLAFMGAPLLSGLVNAIALYSRRPWLMPVWRRVRSATSRALAKTSSQFLVLQLAMAGAFYSDALIATAIIGPSAAAEYSVASTLFLVPMGLVAAGLASLWPAYTEALARGDAKWIRLTVRRSLLIGLAISVPSAAAITLLSSQILTSWIDDAVVPPSSLIIGMAIWTVLRGVGAGMATVLNGLRLLRVQIVTALVMAILNVALSVALTLQIGVTGVVLGTLISYTVATLVPLSLYLPRVLARLESSTAPAEVLG